MLIVAGTSNPVLAKNICKEAQCDLTKIALERFTDGEIYLEITDNVRGQDVFVIQSTSTPVNENLMELLVIIDALRRGSARRITAVLPYYGYARQDRKTSPRSPITAKLVAGLIEKSGANRLLTIDLHSGQIQGFFDIPADNLYARPVLARSLLKTVEDLDTALIVSPDVGGVARVRDYARLFPNGGIAIIDKRRPQPGMAEAINVIGDPSGRTCVLIDDIIDSGHSMCKAASLLIEKGAKRVLAYASHGVLSGEAAQKIQESPLEKLVITNTIATTASTTAQPKIEVVSIAPLIAQAIVRISNEQSVSSLFD